MRGRDYFPVAVATWIGALLFLTLLGLIVHRADAADAQLSWTAPTQREDGAALAATAIAGYDIEWGKCGQAQQTVRVGPVTSHTITGLGYGEWCFRIRTADSGGLLSAWTGAVTKVILAPPKPPVFTTVNIVAYDVRWQAGGGTKLARAVGTVALGTACGERAITRRGLRAYHEVPLDQVDLRSLPNSPIVVAECEVSS